jgi:C-terminal peptidase prc
MMRLPSAPLAALLLSLCATTACTAPAAREAGSVAPSPQSAEDTLPADLRARTFDVVWTTVHRTFWDSAFADTEWRRIGEQHRERVVGEADNRRFHAALRAMLGELGRSHFTVVSPDALRERALTERRSTGTLGVTVRVVRDRLLVTRVAEGGAAAAAGLLPGDAIVRVVELGDSAPAAVGRLPSPRDTAASTLARLLNGPSGTTVRLLVHSPDGSARGIVLRRAAKPGTMQRRHIGFIPLGGPARYLELEQRKLDGNLGYVRISTFIYGTGGRIQRAVRELAGTRGIVVDLRGNPGGEDAVALQLANSLAREPAAFMHSRLRHGTRIDRVRPVRNAYPGRVVILLDSASSSASEQFAAGMQALRRASVVGERTRGRVLDARTTILPTGALFQYARGEPRTPEGTVIEGRGVIPDVEVPVTINTLACRCDPQLQAAVELLARP